MKRKIWLVLILGILVSVSGLQSALIVDWGGTAYVSATTTPMGGQNATSPQGGFSGGDPLLLNPTANYDSAQTSGVFYGAVTWTTTGADGNFGSVMNAVGGDRMEFKRYNTDLNVLVVWRQADFLNGHSTGNVGFDSSSTVSMRMNTFVNFDAGRVVLRLQGGSNDGYYISQQAPFNSTASTISANFTTLTWLAYDPATSLSDFGAPVDLLSGGLIDHVTEVGFYVHSNATSANAFRLDSFEVNSIAIPEPSTWALLLGSMGALLFLRRRQEILPLPAKA